MHQKIVDSSEMGTEVPNEFEERFDVYSKESNSSNKVAENGFSNKSGHDISAGEIKIYRNSCRFGKYRYNRCEWIRI